MQEAVSAAVQPPSSPNAAAAPVSPPPTTTGVSDAESTVLPAGSPPGTSSGSGGGGGGGATSAVVDDKDSSASPPAAAATTATATADAASSNVGLAALSALPAGAAPLFLTGASQELFRCRIDAEVTEQQPYKLIPLEEIKQDFVNRAAVCDFHPFKEQLQDYAGEEILIIYDADFKFGQNFVICLTEEAKATFLQAHVAEAEAELEKVAAEEEAVIAEIKTRRQQGWVSLGSEAEIAEAQCQPTRRRIRLVLSRKRRFFGGPVTLQDAVTAPDHEYPPATQFMSQQSLPGEGGEAAAAQPLRRLLVDSATQAVSETTSTSMQTNWRQPFNAATQWEPRMADGSSTAEASTGTEAEDAPSTNAGSALASARRQRSAHGRSALGVSRQPSAMQLATAATAATAGSKASLPEFLSRTLPSVEHALWQNSLMDLFADDFLRLSSEKPLSLGTKADSVLREHQSFKFISSGGSRFSVNSVDWHPTLPGVLAVAYGATLTFDERVNNSSNVPKAYVGIWSLVDPIYPQLVLEAPDDVFCARFNPRTPHLVIGGCFNGQLAIWDLSRHMKLVRTTVEDGAGTNKNENSNANKSERDASRRVPFIARSNIDSGHRVGVTDLIWLPPGTEIDSRGCLVEDANQDYCYQVLSAAADGTCLVWDLRMETKDLDRDISSKRESMQLGLPPTSTQALKQLDLLWKPLLRVYVSSDVAPEYLITRACIAPQSSKARAALAGLSNSGGVPEQLKAVERSTTLYVGTEQGHVATLDWRPPESESGKLGVQVVGATMSVHGGAVVALERAPYFPLFLLSVSADCLCLWKEGLKAPLLVYRAVGVRYTTACWSFHRSAVFFVGRTDGMVDVWDLTHSSYAPLSSQPVCLPTAVSFLVPGHLLYGSISKGAFSFLAAGTSEGVVHLMELPKGITQPVSNERTQVQEMLEREAARLSYVSEREAVRPPPDRKMPEVEEKDEAKLQAEQIAGRRKELDTVFKSYVISERAFLKAMGLDDDMPEN